MPDNPNVPWLLQPIYADQIGGEGGPLAQFVKVAVGGNGVGTEVPGDAANGLDVDVTRIQTPVICDPLAVAAAVVTRIVAHAAAVSDVVLNTNRRGLIVYNDSPNDMLVKYGAGVSTTSFTVRILAKGYWEMPHPIFVGILSFLWESGAPTGAALVTES